MNNSSNDKKEDNKEDNNEDNNEEVNDEDLVLSEQTLNALKEFYEEKQNNLTNNLNENNGYIEENWQLSQFWYSEETANYLSDEVINAMNGMSGTIACISCPTIFAKLLDQLEKSETYETKNLILFEFDTRFEAKYPSNFIFYDYNQPIDNCMKDRFKEHSFDVVIADPPFLSEECIQKIMETIKYLSKDKILICSGAVMRDMIVDCLQLEQCEHFIPKHQRQLGNEFRCFSNFPLRLSNNK